MGMTLTHEPLIYEALFNYTKKESPKGTLNGDEVPDTTMMTRQQVWSTATSLTGSTNMQRLNYLAGGVWVDDAFGALIDYLKLNNIYDNTFIVVMNDHGMGAK